MTATRERLRIYEVYADYRDPKIAHLTTYSIHYSRGTHRYIWTVRARNVKEAYKLVNQEWWAFEGKEDGIIDFKEPWI
jgi:hypothetical protein